MNKLLTLFLLLPLLCLSQDFSDEDYIYLNRSEHIKIKLNKDTFDISKDVSEKATYLTSKKLYFANESMAFDSFKSMVHLHTPNHNAF